MTYWHSSIHFRSQRNGQKYQFTQFQVERDITYKRNVKAAAVQGQICRNLQRRQLHRDRKGDQQNKMQVNSDRRRTVFNGE